MLIAYAQVGPTGARYRFGWASSGLRILRNRRSMPGGRANSGVLSPLPPIRDDDRCGGSATEPSTDPAAHRATVGGTSYRVEVRADAETRSITTSALPDALSAKAQFSVGRGEGA